MGDPRDGWSRKERQRQDLVDAEESTASAAIDQAQALEEQAQALVGIEASLAAIASVAVYFQNLVADALMSARRGVGSPTKPRTEPVDWIDRILARQEARARRAAEKAGETDG